MGRLKSNSTEGKKNLGSSKEEKKGMRKQILKREKTRIKETQGTEILTSGDVPVKYYF